MPKGKSATYSPTQRTANLFKGRTEHQHRAEMAAKDFEMDRIGREMFEKGKAERAMNTFAAAGIGAVVVAAGAAIASMFS